RRLRGGPATAPRTATSAGMLAARERAAGSAARAALLGRTPATPEAAATEGSSVAAARPEVAVMPVAPSSTAPATSAPERVAPSMPQSPEAPRAGPQVQTRPAPGAQPDASEPATDTIARLREAKRRARGG